MLEMSNIDVLLFAFNYESYSSVKPQSHSNERVDDTESH